MTKTQCSTVQRWLSVARYHFFCFLFFDLLIDSTVAPPVCVITNLSPCPSSSHVSGACAAFRRRWNNFGISASERLGRGAFSAWFLLCALTRVDTLPHISKRSFRHLISDVHCGWVTPSKTRAEGQK